MSLYKPSELIQFLQSLGIRPKKSLSQNFLLDRNIIMKMIALASVTSSDVILEIGPGPGSLTEALLDQGAHVVAVEKDRVLAKALERLNTENRKLTVHSEDIREFPIEETLRPIVKDKAKVIANLPYHLTTPILTQLIPMHTLFSKVIVMVQEEVARRFTAGPGSKEYGSISLFLRYYSTPKYAFTVSRNCFYPKPKVQSAIVEFELHPPPTVSNQEEFFRLIRTAFEKRRKMLSSSLKELYSNVREALESLQLNPKARPEDLSLEEFIAFFETLKQSQP